jgi:hypothetical protein
MFTETDWDGVERTVAEEVVVEETHTVQHGEMTTEISVETDLPEDHEGARYVEPSVYYSLVEGIGVDPESVRIHKFEEAE